VASLPVTDSYFSPKVKESTRAFYSASNQTKWLGNVAPTELFYAFTNNVKQSDQYGLRPDDYAITSIEESVKSLYASSPIDSSAIIKLDIGITSMFFLFSSHLVEGRLQKAGHGSKIWIRENSKTTDLVAILFGIDKPEKLREAMNHLQPVHEQYAKLLQALDQYRYLDKVSPQIEGAIAVTGKIQPNDHHAAIPLIRDRISYTDMRPDSLMRDSLRYDEALVSAVKWFQLRHGLEPDGIIGAGTLKFLNQSFKEKADIIALNLERLRWIPETYGDNYIVVNLPEYKMSVFEDKKFALEMKVIVGSAETPTPVFADTLRHIVFSPTWSVPTSIIKNEIIPRLQRDSSYYSSKNYVFYKGGVRIDPANEIWRDQTINPYSLSVVQQPGPDNSLGLVKFVMPNHMNIYLHDTPGQRLFKRSYRALSHGCIRLDEPAELAEFLLKDQRGWDEEAIAKAMRGEQPATLFIKKMYRVQLEYYTAWVDENGLVNFREDIYGHDKYQLALLNPKKKQTKEEVNIIDISGAGN
ncbi:MAG TPA: L,D-transpeptidase family protein, partial [Cyclobacteriaceae bacterium]